MEISREALAALVFVAKAHGVRAEARALSKRAKQAIEPAEKLERHFGGFEDCGDSYRSQLDEAKGIFNAAVAHEISSEKAYKKARLTTLERFPALAPLIEEFVNETPQSSRKNGQNVKHPLEASQ